jgi:hypothetical protein
MKLDHLVCPICGKNSPLSPRKGYKAGAEFPVTEDTTLIQVREYIGGKGNPANMKTIDTISIKEAMKDSTYKPYILLLRNKARSFLFLTS